MNELIPLAFADRPLRMVMVDRIPWWVLADVAPLLGLSNPSKLAARLEDYQRDTIPHRDSVGRRRNLIVVNEPGVYQLVSSSPKPAAKAFAKWLFTEVLPSIRKTGSYVTPARLAELQHLIDPAPVPPRQGERFRLEREAFEAREGFKLLDAIKGVGVLSPAKLRSIEQHDSRISAKLYMILDSIGLDIKFIRYGEPRLSRAEKALCAAWQAGDTPTRAAMLSVAAVTVPRLN